MAKKYSLEQIARDFRLNPPVSAPTVVYRVLRAVEVDGLKLSPGGLVEGTQYSADQFRQWTQDGSMRAVGSVEPAD